MNIFDLVIVLVIISFVVLGAKRGTLKEFLSFVGKILVFVFAFLLKDVVALFLTANLPAIKIASSLGKLSSLSILFYQLISFLLLLIVLNLLLRILISVSGLLGKVINYTVILALPNRIFGCILGLLEGYLIVFLALNILMIPLSGSKMYLNSVTRNFIMNETPILKDSLGGINYALNEILTIENSTNENETNLKVIDTMLKYKIISKDYIETLRENKKLDDIKGIDTILDKYKENEE